MGSNFERMVFKGVENNVFKEKTWILNFPPILKFGHCEPFTYNFFTWKKTMHVWDSNSVPLETDVSWKIKIHPENSYNAVDEADHLIAMCDEDDDDKLTADEIIEEQDLWLESPGTEYGHTLRHMDEL